MALHANNPEQGSWVTEKVTIQALLSANDRPATADEDCRPPECGLLTRTVIESPVVQWILPARLRSAARNDVAFIGVRQPFGAASYRPIRSAELASYVFSSPAGRRCDGWLDCTIMFFFCCS